MSLEVRRLKVVVDGIRFFCDERFCLHCMFPGCYAICNRVNYVIVAIEVGFDGLLGSW